MTNGTKGVTGGAPAEGKEHIKRGDATHAMLAALEALMNYYETVIQESIPATAGVLKQAQAEQDEIMKKMAEKAKEQGVEAAKKEPDEAKKGQIAADLQALQNEIQMNQYEQASITRNLQALVQGSTTDIAAAGKIVTSMEQFFSWLR